MALNSHCSYPGGPVVVDGKTIGCIVVFKDISDIVTVQEELSSALAKAEVLMKS